jgi:hypothetical protein
MSHLNNDTIDKLCEIKHLSAFHFLFTEYKYPELMYTVTFFILLMYAEEFLFVFRKIPLSCVRRCHRRFNILEYVLVRLGYARPLIIQTIMFEIHPPTLPTDSLDRINDR